MKCLITGANGYLGRKLVALYKGSTHQVIEVVREPSGHQLGCDLTDVKQVHHICNLAQPDLIIHCAAFVPRALKEYENAVLSKKNIWMLENIISASKAPIIYISSMTVYGEASIIRRKESDAGNPASEYGKSKYECELLLEKSKRDAMAVRIPGLFGARQKGLVANLIQSLMQREKPTLPDVPLLWAAINVLDAAEGIFQLSQSDFKGFNPVNLGYDEVYSINRLIEICEDIFDVEIEHRIKHPQFAFDLSYLTSFSVKLNSNLRTSLLKLKAESHEFI